MTAGKNLGSITANKGVFFRSWRVFLWSWLNCVDIGCGASGRFFFFSLATVLIHGSIYCQSGICAIANYVYILVKCYIDYQLVIS